jgi:enhancing lycopene biosynthesis protein 2
MAYNIGVLLSGCGVMDGSEIHEAVLTLLAIDNAGAKAVCMAPNTDQMHVVDHLAGTPAEGQTRNCLVEAARIARGDIRDLATVAASDIDALILPGGFGAAKNLCDYATAGPDMTVAPDVARLIKDVHAAGKPIGVICIAPVIMAAVAGKDLGIRVSLTIGTDDATAEHIVRLGAEHVNCPVKEFVVDKANKIVSTPAYMIGQGIGEVAVGIEKLVKAVMELI